jgi:transcription initiation factor TFIIB
MEGEAKWLSVVGSSYGALVNVKRLSVIVMQISSLCSVCNKAATISDPESGETVCGNCGLVLSDNTMETQAEWRNFGTETANRSRAGGPASLARHDMGLATVIGRKNTDAKGAILSASIRSAIGRWRTWDSRGRSHSSSDRNLQTAFDELGRLKTKLNLSSAMVEKTAYIYRKANEKHLARGRSISSLLGACIYISCRELGSSISFVDIAANTSVKRNDLTRMYRIILRELDLKMPEIDPVMCIIRISNKAGLSEKTKRQAIRTMNDAVKREKRAGKNPMGFAASLLYIACLISGEHINQKALADAAGVTEVTLRNRLKDFRQSSIMGHATLLSDPEVV